MNEEQTDAEAVPEDISTVGARLKAERESRGLSLTDIAERTRVPMRHLESLERSDHHALPGVTYEIGFAKSYARALELDDSAIATELRDEIGYEDTHSGARRVGDYEPTDPARVPPRILAWTAAIIAILLVAGYGLWRGLFLSDEPVDRYAQQETEEADSRTAQGATAAPAATPTPAADGQVVLTATQEVWIRVYDAANDTLLIKTMAPGERYEVPRDADGPMINIGRPEAVQVTVAGQTVAPLGPPERAIKDVGISAKALLARGRGESGSAPLDNG